VSYVTIADYEQWAGVTDDDDVPRVTVSLEAACDAVRDYIGQTIDLVTDDAMEIPGSGTQFLLLPELPVVSVASITDEDAEAVDDWTLRDSGILYRREGWAHGHIYTVTNTHGWATVPADIKIATFQVASSLASSQSGTIQQESIGGYSVSYMRGDDSSPLASIEKRIVKRVPVP
jgi:hypothetical protein